MSCLCQKMFLTKLIKRSKDKKDNKINQDTHTMYECLFDSECIMFYRIIVTVIICGR